MLPLLPLPLLQVLLIVDNCPGHGKEELWINILPNWIKVEFLPANTTSIIQPMDGGIIARLKRRYRRHLLRRMIDREYPSVDAFKKDLDVLQAIMMVTAAWQEVTQDEIQAVWHRTLGIGYADAVESSGDHAPQEPGKWVEEAELEMEIDGLIHKLGRLHVEGIDTSVRGIDWATVDDFIGEDGGPLAVSFDEVLQLLDDEREEEQWEEPPSDGPDALGDEEAGDDDEDASSSRPRAMTFEAAITAARDLSSFLMDVGSRQDDLAMAASLNTLL